MLFIDIENDCHGTLISAFVQSWCYVIILRTYSSKHFNIIHAMYSGNNKEHIEECL